MSTITSPVFSEVAIVLGDRDINELFRSSLFSAVRSVYEVKPFHLVFSLEVWEGYRKPATKDFKTHMNAEAAKGGFDFLPRPPVITFNIRARYARFA